VHVYRCISAFAFVEIFELLLLLLLLVVVVVVQVMNAGDLDERKSTNAAINIS
jgi:hypothetical protein